MDPAAGGRLRLQLQTGRRALRRRSEGAGRLARRRGARAAEERATAARSCRCPAGAAGSARNAPPEARAAAARLADPATVAVVTGQQAGAFGGPLLHAPQGADRAPARAPHRARLGVPVVAVFWVDAEDHDWEEVRELYGARRRVPAAHRDAGGSRRAPASCRSRSSQLDARVEQTIDELAAVLQQTEFTAADPRRPPRRVEARDAAWRARSRPGSKRCSGRTAWSCSSRPIRPPSRWSPTSSRKELSSPGRTAALAAEAGEALAARGHAPQVVPQPDSVSLFRLNGGRTPIKKQGDQLVIGETTHSSEELAREATTQPRAVQPERAAPADRPGHALPHHLLRRRPERAGLPRPARAASTRRSACRCR